MPVGEDDRLTNRNMNASGRGANVNLTKAGIHRALADNQQSAMREAISHNRKLTPSSSRISPSGENDGKGLPSGRKNVFKSLVGVVMERNREYKALQRHVADSDVSTERGKAVFWGTDDRDKDIGAKTTAAAYAKANDKKTLEQTPGGRGLDNYGGGWNYQAERFKYRAKESQETEPTSKLWEDISERFAQQSSGDVDKVFGVSKDNPWLANPKYKETAIWEKRERSMIEAQGQKINNFYQGSPQLTPHQKRQDSAQNSWKDTGGFKGLPAAPSTLRDTKPKEPNS